MATLSGYDFRPQCARRNPDDRWPVIIFSGPADRLAFEGRLLCIDRRFRNKTLSLMNGRHQIGADRVVNLQITHFGFADDDK